MTGTPYGKYLQIMTTTRRGNHLQDDLSGPKTGRIKTLLTSIKTLRPLLRAQVDTRDKAPWEEGIKPQAMPSRLVPGLNTSRAILNELAIFGSHFLTSCATLFVRLAKTKNSLLPLRIKMLDCFLFILNFIILGLFSLPARHCVFLV